MRKTSHYSHFALLGQEIGERYQTLTQIHVVSQTYLRVPDGMKTLLIDPFRILYVMRYGIHYLGLLGGQQTVKSRVVGVSLLARVTAPSTARAKAWTR